MLSSSQTKIHETAIRIASDLRKTEAELLKILSEVDRERVYLALGFSNLFSYCVEALNLSEAQSYAFMAVSRKSRVVPELKNEIVTGTLTISKAVRITSVITPENKSEWLEKAVTLSKPALEKEVRKALPENSLQKESLRRVSEEKFSLKIEISEETFEKLKRAQVLLSKNKRATLNLESTVAEALEFFLKAKDPVEKAKREKSKPATKCENDLLSKQKGPASLILEDRVPLVVTTSQPTVQPTFRPCPGKSSPASTTGSVKVLKRSPIPAFVKNAIARRDKGRCQFKNLNKTCENTYFTEVHHIKPVSKGGDNQLQNLITLCSKHHKYLHAPAARIQSPRIIANEPL